MIVKEFFPSHLCHVWRLHLQRVPLLPLVILVSPHYGGGDVLSRGIGQVRAVVKDLGKRLFTACQEMAFYLIIPARPPCRPVT